MSHDPKNPISNETGEYLQEVAEAMSLVEEELFIPDHKPDVAAAVRRAKRVSRKTSN